ncbi:peroxynitrite isomerase THAP4-like [Lytechinus variegatus]|uniref:peroxynitrite isomerase THAP4-like n=1 Tax=Lytechinus variegatus TaxID=7654 RepID=UPI001BB12D2C|nr:peroxynitrite isomerase THAP4-like [Lytechinus variegatus]
MSTGVRGKVLLKYFPGNFLLTRRHGTVPLHGAIQQLSWLLGIWESETAKGFFPTIKQFEYKETLEFTHVGQPILNFRSRAFSIPENEPKHAENGFLRINIEKNLVSFMVAMNIGIVEISEGKLVDSELHLESIGLHHMSHTSLPITTKVTRTFNLIDNATLEQNVSMATVSTPTLTPHLSVRYKKVLK